MSQKIGNIMCAVVFGHMINIYCSYFFIINKRFNMNYQYILEESSDTNLQTNSRTKLHFLQAEKIRQEEVVRQMEQQIKLQRAINQDLAKGSILTKDELVHSLTLQNGLLEEQYLRIKNENDQLTSNLLIHQQLMDSNQFDLAASLRSYQEKIIELRRAIQQKEGAIQNLQSKLKLCEDRIIAPSTNVSFLFFHEIEQLKNAMSKVSNRNKQLQFQNNSLILKNQQLTKKIQLIESLTLKSQLTYEEFKHYYNYDHQKTRNSAPKKGVYIPLKERLTQLTLKKTNEVQTTRQCSQSSSLPIDSSVKMLVYKYHLEIQRLKEEISRLRNSQRYERKSKNMIAQSYNQIQIKISHLMSELNYYKKSTQDLAKIITYKRQLLHSKSLQKSKQQKIINNINIPSEIMYVTDRKKYWLGVQSSIKIEKVRLFQIKRKYNKINRSLSCIIDYKRLEVDGVDKYLNKKNNNKQKYKKIVEPKDSNDFSRMIEAPFQDDFSIIQAVSSKKTYSEWKKNSQKKSVFNLTIIEENIL